MLFFFLSIFTTLVLVFWVEINTWNSVELVLFSFVFLSWTQPFILLWFWNFSLKPDTHTSLPLCSVKRYNCTWLALWPDSCVRVIIIVKPKLSPGFSPWLNIPSQTCLVLNCLWTSDLIFTTLIISLVHKLSLFNLGRLYIESHWKLLWEGRGWPGGFQCSTTELRVLILDGYVFFHSLSSHLS